MRAKDIMSSPVHTIWRHASVQSAAEVMARESVTALPVVGSAGELVGMVSEGDLLRHRVGADPTAHMRRLPPPDPAERPEVVAEVMSEKPLTTWPGADVAEVAEAMLRHDVRSMPVVDDDGHLAGIISRRDILRAVIRGDDVLAREVQHRLDEYADGADRWTATVASGVATVTGEFANETEQAVVTVLARTVPGVAAVHIGTPAGKQ